LYPFQSIAPPTSRGITEAKRRDFFELKFCPVSLLNLVELGISLNGGKPVLLFTKLIFSSNSDKELISHHLISGTYWVKTSMVAC